MCGANIGGVNHVLRHDNREARRYILACLPSSCGTRITNVHIPDYFASIMTRTLCGGQPEQADTGMFMSLKSDVASSKFKFSAI